MGTNVGSLSEKLAPCLRINNDVHAELMTPLGTITTFHSFSLLRVAFLKDLKIVLNEGYLYRVTALQFKEDNRIGWAAEHTFAVRGRSDRQI